MREDFLPFGKPQILQEDIDRAVEVLKTGWIGTGPRVKEFEQKFAEYKSVDPDLVVAVNSCTAGLILSLEALDLGAGDEVITTPMTFCATVNSILHVGATPVLIDIDVATRNIDASKIEEKITDKTKAIMLVHFAGYPCDMDKICKIAKEHNIKIIEDCAHAIETEYKGEKAGTFGDFGCFSFYATKNLTTGGEGGAVICKNKSDADYIRRISLHGMSKDAWKRFSHKGFAHYDVVDLGYKCNLTDYAASVGIGGLERIDVNHKWRERICDQYSNAFVDLPISLPVFKTEETEFRHAYHLYSILIDPEKAGITRDEFADKMNALNIGVGIHYRCVTSFSYYQETLKWSEADAPNAKRVGDQNVSLPLSASMSEYDVQTVIDGVLNVFQ